MELGAALAAVARRNLARFPAVEVVTAAFEDWPLPEEPFDLVLAATAFHWIDPAVRVDQGGRRAPARRRARDRHHPPRRRRGRVVLRPGTGLLRALGPRDPPGGAPLRPAIDIPSSSDELDRSHRFGPATFRRYEWEQSYTTAGYVEVLLTYSGHRALDPAAQTGLLDCIAHLIDTGYGGRITKRYLTELRMASTIGPDPAPRPQPRPPRSGQVRRAGQLTSRTPATTAAKPSRNRPLRRSPRSTTPSSAATTGFRLT